MPEVLYVHVVEGRLRVRLADLKGDRVKAREVVAHVAHGPGSEPHRAMRQRAAC